MKRILILMGALLIPALVMAQNAPLRYTPLITKAAGDTLTLKGSTAPYRINLNTVQSIPTVTANGKYAVSVIFRVDSNATNKAPRAQLQYSTGRSVGTANQNRASSDTSFVHGFTGTQWRNVFGDSMRAARYNTTIDTTVIFDMAEMLSFRFVILDTNFVGGPSAKKDTFRIKELTIGTK